MKHSKHAKLNKPSIGSFGRNEWAFLGAPCGVIKDLVESISKNIPGSYIYIDETHNHDGALDVFPHLIKHGEEFEINHSHTWNKNGNRSLLGNIDFLFINGNHFEGAKQIVFLNSKKEESLSRKLDRLSNVKCFIHSDDVAKPYNFLKNHLSHWETIPSFHISEVEHIADFIVKDYEAPQLKSLILAGGKSQRMGYDKGKISYHGIPQREYFYSLLGEITDEAFISCREEQVLELINFNTISDKFIGLGPFGAIASAFMNDPDAAWLIVPCDLPLLGNDELQLLIDGRNPHKFGTAFLNNETHFPEPLISIWEPKMYQHMLGFLTQGYSCPRKVLINSEIELLEVENQLFMTNVNTPEDQKSVKNILSNK